MALRGVHTLLLALTWTTFFNSTLGTHRFKARIKVKRENAAFLSFTTSSGHMIDNLKLIHNPNSETIYAGSPQGLYMFNPNTASALEKVCVPIFELENPINSTDCVYIITLLKEGRNGNPLFMCGTRTDETMCCDVTSEHRPVNCHELRNPTEINDPSVHVADSLYYTISSGTEDPSGLYRFTKERATWPVPRDTEMRHVKILENQGNGPLDGKLYIFYTEQTLAQDLDLPLWIPRVSQICMADRGGSKAKLQFRWSSLLTARLFCGDEKKHLSYTELLDVSVLEAAEWENTTVYALFKNAYNLSAVCVYKMSDIIRVFTSNEFRDNTETFSSPRPGECVEDSPKLPPIILSFMADHPVMNQWIKPARDPLLFNHYHYTHLLVDRVKSNKSGNSHHDVLLMSLENGNVHKILAQDGDPFVIAEYEPFTTRTHISSMLLDNENKTLYVSSGAEVIQIRLQNCSVYGNRCDSCVMARDPYCGWDWTTCSNTTQESIIQDVTHGNYSICNGHHTCEIPTNSKRDSPNVVPQDSKYFLTCPMESQHASYAWVHQDRRRECVSAEQDCLLLIDSMSEKDEGVYNCVASENGCNRTIVHQKLQMNAASQTRTTHAALAWLLFLIYVIC